MYGVVKDADGTWNVEEVDPRIMGKATIIDDLVMYSLNDALLTEKVMRELFRDYPEGMFK